MCGIGAIAAVGRTMPAHEARPRIDEMLAQLHHRGPDESSTQVEPEIAFAFARLSLVGIENGSQPLSTPDGDLVLVVNGEVYNHRALEMKLGVAGQLRTRSDCEVLLHQYRRHGVRFLDDVRGMFAVILWDRRNQKLILARDRFGIKPVYFHRDATRIVASSEIKALMVDPATPREVDWRTALGVLDLTGVAEFAEGEVCTWFKEIESVPAATILEFDLSDGSMTSHQYWSLPEPNEDWSEERFIREYREALEISVHECATADAELGLFLSGGVDSAAVLALAGSTDIHTFSAVTAGSLLNGDVDAAAWVSDRFGNPHHQVEFPDENTPTPDQWKRLLWLTETPLCGPEIYYKYELHRYARAVRPDLRGMLLGAASDEFNGGYTVQTSGDRDWEGFRRNLAFIADRTDLARAPAASWQTDYPLPLLREDFVRATAGAAQDTYARYLRSEYRKVQQYNVWHDDRTAAGSGTEARVPFLDHRVVEISASVPDRLRSTLLWDKAILRRAMEGIVPDRSRKRPKVPFFYGVGARHTYRMIMRMVNADSGHLVEQALAAPGAADHLDADNIRAVLSAVDPTRASAIHSELLLRLINLGLLSDLAKSLPQVSTMDAGPVRQRVPDGTSGRELAARVAVVDSADRLPLGRYLLPEGVSLHRDVVNSTGCLVRDGEILFVFERDSPTFDALGQLARGETLARVHQDQPADVVDRVRDDLLQLHNDELIVATTETDQSRDGWDGGQAPSFPGANDHCRQDRSPGVQGHGPSVPASGRA